VSWRRITLCAERCELLGDIFGKPFRAVTLERRGLTTNVRDLARTIPEERVFDRLTILAAALVDAGCFNDDLL